MTETRMPSEIVTQINLTWHGPFHVGNFKETFFPRLDAYRGPHVYLSIQEYTQRPDVPLTVAYVGQAGNFYYRMSEHYKFTLGLGYRVRDATGKYIYELEDEKYLNWMDDIRNTAGLVIEEVIRTKYLCAPCDEANLNRVEAALISCVKQRVGRAENVCLECDNGNRPTHGHNGEPIKIVNAAENGSADVDWYLRLVFDSEPIFWA